PPRPPLLPDPLCSQTPLLPYPPDPPCSQTPPLLPDPRAVLSSIDPRDFAYVARDKNTRVLKCHVFRCDTPAAGIATSLHEVCSKYPPVGRQ
ncbi:hypothetical protein CRUP_031363, partial [Coryphaenoides rupestris]